MKMLISLVIAVSAVAAAGQVQDKPDLTKPKRAPEVVDSTPVTKAEAQATFRHVADLFRTVWHVSVSPIKFAGGAAAPVTRSEVIAEFIRLYKSAEPVFIVTPKAVKIDVDRLVFDKPSEKSELEMMVERGCVGNYGPLATGKKTTLTVSQFGDALGFLLARIGECTHTPSSKWTPYLHN